MKIFEITKQKVLFYDNSPYGLYNFHKELKDYVEVCYKEDEDGRYWKWEVVPNTIMLNERFLFVVLVGNSHQEYSKDLEEEDKGIMELEDTEDGR